MTRAKELGSSMSPRRRLRGARRSTVVAGSFFLVVTLVLVMALPKQLYRLRSSPKFGVELSELEEVSIRRVPHADSRGRRIHSSGDTYRARYEGSSLRDVLRDVSGLDVIEVVPLPMGIYDVEIVSTSRSGAFELLCRAQRSAFWLRVAKKHRPRDVFRLECFDPEALGTPTATHSSGGTASTVQSESNCEYEFRGSAGFLADAIGEFVRAPVVDRTALEGEYTGTLIWDPRSVESLRAALDRIGLRLTPGIENIEAVYVTP